MVRRGELLARVEIVTLTLSSGDELVRKLMGDEHADVLRETLPWFARELMEAEVASQVGAGRHEKSAQRVTHRNG